MIIIGAVMVLNGRVMNLNRPEFDRMYEANVKLADNNTLLKKENEELKNKFNNLKEWLNIEVKRIEHIITKEKPYGEELHLYQNSINRFIDVLEKIEKLELYRED